MAFHDNLPPRAFGIQRISVFGFIDPPSHSAWHVIGEAVAGELTTIHEGEAATFLD
jgi:hypothetical protein